MGGWMAVPHLILEPHPQVGSAFALQIDLCILSAHGSPVPQSEISLMTHGSNPLHFLLQVTSEPVSLFNIHG